MIAKGQKINDRYSIIKTIGEGGMANVYLAYDTILDRNVAVKVLRGDLANDEKFVRRFQREALSASSLSHPNIVEVYDVGEDDGQYYIVMEYIEGKHLKQLLKKRPGGKLSLTETIDIMSQITEGLAHAHDSYIVHRDIKPQNIMILENGIVKITDFGIATALNSTQLTQTNSVMGSVHYLPPEQAGGKGTSMRSDIYSMGILMYELLTGKLPFSGDNAVEIALKQLKEPIPSIRKELPNIPQAVENVIIKATAKNPKNRYADAREMNEDLKTVLDESRAHEPKYKYSFPETELDDTKIMKMVKQTQEMNKGKEEFKIAHQISKKELKKQNKTVITLASIFTGLVLLTTTIVVLLFVLTDKKNVTIPDVTNLTVSEAEKKLQKMGFETNSETKTINSDNIDEGKVVKTSPAIGRSVKEGTIITLYESIGENTYVLEDYKDRDYIEVKTELEKVYNLNVIVEKQDVEEVENLDVNGIIAQKPAKGEKVTSGDTVYLYIPNITATYPDFTDGSWSLTDIEAFAKKYSLVLTVAYEESLEYTAGAIMSQSREHGSTIVPNISLKIVIAEEVTTDTEETLETVD